MEQVTVVHKDFCKKEQKKVMVYCGRGSPLGNPFIMKGTKETRRDAVCDKYIEWFYDNVDEINFLDLVEAKGIIKATPQTRQLIRLFRLAFKGDVALGCYCAPQRCHCDTIKSFLDNKLEELEK